MTNKDFYRVPVDVYGNFEVADNCIKDGDAESLRALQRDMKRHLAASREAYGEELDAGREGRAAILAANFNRDVYAVLLRRVDAALAEAERNAPKPNSVGVRFGVRVEAQPAAVFEATARVITLERDVSEAGALWSVDVRFCGHKLAASKCSSPETALASAFDGVEWRNHPVVVSLVNDALAKTSAILAAGL